MLFVVVEPDAALADLKSELAKRVAERLNPLFNEPTKLRELWPFGSTVGTIRPASDASCCGSCARTRTKLVPREGETRRYSRK